MNHSLPLGACIATPEIAASLKALTIGGHPLVPSADPRSSDLNPFARRGCRESDFVPIHGKPRTRHRGVRSERVAQMAPEVLHSSHEVREHSRAPQSTRPRLVDTLEGRRRPDGERQAHGGSRRSR